ncbi:MAG: toxin HicA [Sulfitobacter sp.]|nr:MAG: toxin HicA [Sulfitobacter sp.]
MSKTHKIIKEMENSPKKVKFSDLAKVCEEFFGKLRNKGTSHHVYKTPWPGDPRVNIQKSKNGNAKAYQVKQVLKAIKKLKEIGDG